MPPRVGSTADVAIATTSDGRYEMKANCGRMLALLTSTAAALVLAASASATPPIKEDGAPTHVSFPAGLVCSFGVTIDSVANGVFTIAQSTRTGTYAGSSRRVGTSSASRTTRPASRSSSTPAGLERSCPSRRIAGDRGTGPALTFFPTDSPSQELLLVNGNFEFAVAPDGTLTLLDHVGPPPRDLCADCRRPWARDPAAGRAPRVTFSDTGPRIRHGLDRGRASRR